MGIQSGANEDQDACAEENDRIVMPQTEGAYAIGEHEGAEGIDNVCQGIEMGNDL